ncbi:DUF3592 domain-containing protein [Streptomyces bluensis]|uniref:DUF3592 domain-containing protein n=1 Tax=Streptomyces bluensis TaxID=33897 RepID=UPI0019C0121D|nr:DUF3592 domain-containing protein [Streptomyces bluensis]GGZ86903.1 hypothetical protein GCM10010344_63030 [Streptomyces bluensis]
MKVQARGQGARRWIMVGTIAFGALFLVVALILAGVSVSFLVDAERARGTVVALEWRNDDHNGASRKTRGNNRPAAYPVVEFTSAEGTPRKFRDSTGSNPPSYEVGEEVEVLYRADSPEDARIKGFASLWLLPLVFGGIGLLIGGIGTVVALATRGRSQAARSPQVMSPSVAPRG